MLKLIKNEWIKIFSKVSTYIMLVLVALFVIGFAGLMFINSRYEYDSRFAVDENSRIGVSDHQQAFRIRSGCIHV